MQLAAARRRIDRLDHEIVWLLNERAKATVDAGIAKRDLALPICCREREASVLSNIRKANRGPSTDKQLARIYRELTRFMHGLQMRLRRNEQWFPVSRRKIS
jgi:chorismate mutase/prephenate dehydratase